MARLERFELPTARFVAEYSIQLSYRRLIEGAILRIKLRFFQSNLVFIKIFSFCVCAYVAENFVGDGFSAISYVIGFG